MIAVFVIQLAGKLGKGEVNIQGLRLPRETVGGGSNDRFCKCSSLRLPTDRRRLGPEKVNCGASLASER